jgi:TonB family protein
LSQTLQLEEVKGTELHPEPPRLLVEWTPRWHEFVTSIGPALGRSEARLAGEAPFGLLPYRIVVPAYVLEAFLILAAIIVPVKLAQMRPYVAPRLSSHDVIYYSGDELPRVEDLGGSDAGRAGRAGGQEAHHRTQTIRIARGGSLVPRVVDAPNLKIPSSRDAVANLLAVNPNPGPPPLEGVRSARSVTNLTTSVVAPAPNVIRDYTRNGVRLDGVIAPAPNVQRDQAQRAPNFSATVVPPAPDLARDHALVAPAMSPAVIPPAPGVARDHTLIAPSLNAQVVAPSPSMTRDRSRSTPALASNVIPPAPVSVSREISTAPVQMANAAVVPPPVSAPERASRRDPRLTLPATSVIAPPPSPDVARDLHRLASGNVPDPAKTVVPPPPTQTSSGSYMSSLIGRIFGASEVVPPPPSVSTNGTGGTVSSLPANVVPPPPSVSATAASGSPHGNRQGMGASLGSNVIAPPPTTGVSGGTGTRSVASSTAPVVGLPSVVPPPPALAGTGGGIGNTAGGNGTSAGTLLANNIVPPPPSLGGGSNASGSGLGRKGTGLGAPMEVGAPVAPSTAGGSGASAGVVVSSQPGAKVGLPAAVANGAISMSPAGGDKPGLGGAGGGTSIGRGEGTGSALSGAGAGAGKTGAAHGTDPDAHGGISPAVGPGGAGNSRGGKPPVPGVDISGGSSQITLPSFGGDPAANDPAAARRSSTKTQGQTLGVTVVATATSGGAFEPYKNLLKGEKYTTYLDTSLGTVVMEFADESATGHPFGGTLSSPQAIRTALPEGLPRARLIIACTLDASGNLKNVRVLEPGPAEMTAKVVAALRSWKFQPAARGDQSVEVSAILGFNIDTNDRF